MQATSTDLCRHMTFYNRQQLQALVEAIHAANSPCRWSCSRVMDGDSPRSETWHANGLPVMKYEWSEGQMLTIDLR